MRKEEIYIDLSKCSEKQREYIFSLLPKKKYSLQHDYDKYNIFLFMQKYGNSNELEWWVDGDIAPLDKTELTYSDFIKLFEGGEGEKKDTQCVAGCKVFTGGEIKHHKDCPYYPESFTEMYEKLEADKTELLEALEKIFKIGYKPYRNTRNEELEIIDTARNLLRKFQKHKQ